MNEIKLNAGKWENEQDMHRELAEALHFPGYYGANFDALHDCLTELGETALVIENCCGLTEKLGRRWEIALRVFWDSVNENGNLSITLRD